MSPPATVRPRAERAAPLVLLLLFLAHALLYFDALGRDAVDDAYISYRYAQNAVLGNGLVFNPGERVEGFTNFLWTALMVPLEGAAVDVGKASILLGFLLAVGTLALTARFPRNVGMSPWVGILAALLLALDGSFTLWAVSGLETALFGFLLLAGAFFYVREQSREAGSRERIPWSGVLFALSAMTRPEGLMVFGITILHQAAWRLLVERRLVTRNDVARIALFGVLFVPYWLGRWAYYHSFLPNSFYAKVSAAGPQAQLERGWRHLSQFINVHGGWVITLPPLVTVIKARFAHSKSSSKQAAARNTQYAARNPLPPSFWTTYLTAIILPYSLYIVYVGGDWSVGRFFVPLLAPFYLLFSTGVVHMWKWVAARWRGLASRPTAAAASALLSVVIFFFSSWGGEYGIYIRGFDAGTATEARVAMGKWLRANVPRDTWIAVDAAGQVPYFSGLPAIDMFGINDWHIGRMPVANLGQGTPGHEKFDLVYVITREPKYVVIFGTLLDSVPEYARANVRWTDNPGYARFLTLYQRR